MQDFCPCDLCVQKPDPANDGPEVKIIRREQWRTAEEYFFEQYPNLSKIAKFYIEKVAARNECRMDPRTR
jgi:hypothetical protein